MPCIRGELTEMSSLLYNSLISDSSLGIQRPPERVGLELLSARGQIGGYKKAKNLLNKSYFILGSSSISGNLNLITPEKLAW